MKKLFAFIILAVLFFIYPFPFTMLPDDWTLTAKDQIRTHVHKDKKKVAVKSAGLGAIHLNMPRKDVEKQLGKHQSVRRNPYNSLWYVYHQNYRQFVLLGYSHNRVAAIYSNSPQYIDNSGVGTASTLAEIKKKKGQPLMIEEGENYRIRLDEKYILNYAADGVRTTYFYDHFDRSVDAVMVLSEDYFQQKKRFYGDPSQTLARSYERLDFELVNASRVKRGLPALIYHDKLSHTALKHSRNMADKQFFSHIDLKQLSPFDRMTADGIVYSRAGENLAAGQVSPLEAHNGLMNSKGHRTNILLQEYRQLGVGVAFNEENMPYYTENYMTGK